MLRARVVNSMDESGAIVKCKELGRFMSSYHSIGRSARPKAEKRDECCPYLTRVPRVPLMGPAGKGGGGMRGFRYVDIGYAT
jgi:hypothetical protein